MPVLVKILRNGNDFSCAADGGQPFFVGRRVPYEHNIGLYNVFKGSRLEKLNYRSSDFTAAHGFWATFIDPTAGVEGRNFLTLNTYDSARFTFGFGQFAAHVPDGDFVQFFRAMLQLPQGPDYFPHLGLINGRICQTDNPQPLVLEDDHSTKGLMDYLNPDLQEVQDAEVICAAKFIQWTSSTVAARTLQVTQMIETFKSFMPRADARVGIDGRPASQCCVIADILHQGRGGKMTWPLIDAALKSSKPLDSLLAIGAPKWNERTKNLKAAISAQAAFNQMRWSRAAQDFV